MKGIHTRSSNPLHEFSCVVVVMLRCSRTCKLLRMCRQAEEPKLTLSSCPKICYPSVSLHLLPLIPLSTFCHLSGRQRKTDKGRAANRSHSESLGWRAGALDWYRRMWRGLSSLISPPPLACLRSLLRISCPVYQSVHLTQPLSFFFLTHCVFPHLGICAINCKVRRAHLKHPSATVPEHNTGLNQVLIWLECDYFLSSDFLSAPLINH